MRSLGSRDAKRWNAHRHGWRQISLFPPAFSCANYLNLAQRHVASTASARQALSNYVGREIGVVTKDRLPLSKQRARMGMDNASSIIGGMTERIRSVRSNREMSRQPSPKRLSFVLDARNHCHRPVQPTEQLRKSRKRTSRGLSVSSKVSGSDERMQVSPVPSAFLPTT